MDNQSKIHTSFLKKDIITNGLISNLLERYVLEDTKMVVTKRDLCWVHNILFSRAYDKTFGRFAKSIVEPIKIEEASAENELLKGMLDYGHSIINDDSIDYFDKPVVIFHDGIYGSAFGRYQYIYRAKGFRIFWHSDGKITYNNVYMTIDENGFQYLGDDVYAEIDLNNNDTDDLDFEMDFDLHDIITFLKNLLNIKEHFYRDYILEYAVSPSDVYRKSNFSKSLEEDLWNILLDYAASLIETNSREIEYFEKICLLFVDLEISPSSLQIMNFITTVYSSNDRVIEILVNTIKNQEVITESLFDSVFKSCLALQSNANTIIKLENYYNTYLAQLIETRRPDYTIKDQTLRGKSTSGISQGEVDIYIEKSGYPQSILEGMILNSVKKDYIKMHINKIWKYDTSGNMENFMIVYYSGKDFGSFSKRYLKYILEGQFDNSLTDNGVTKMKEYTDIFVYDTVWSINERKSSIKHILINLKQ